MNPHEGYMGVYYTILQLFCRLKHFQNKKLMRMYTTKDNKEIHLNVIMIMSMC